MVLNLIHVFFNLQKGLPAVDDIKHENLGFFLLVCILSLMHQKKGLAKNSYVKHQCATVSNVCHWK